jgi:predicted SAM-dependent methyltransferase
LSTHSWDHTRATKLNLGSGTSKERLFPRPWLNADIAHGADIALDIRMLPADWTGRFDEVRASHVLEHLYLGQWVATLTEWTRVLAPGGVLRVVVPDLDVVMHELRVGVGSGGKPSTDVHGTSPTMTQLYGDDYQDAAADERWRHRMIANESMLRQVLAQVPSLSDAETYHWSADPANGLDIEDDSQSAYSLCMMATKR